MFTLDNHIHNAPVPVVCGGTYTATYMLKLFVTFNVIIIYAVIMHKNSSMQLHASMVTMYTYKHMHICMHAHILSMHAYRYLDIHSHYAYIVITRLP